MNHRLIRIGSLVLLIALLMSGLAQAQLPEAIQANRVDSQVESSLLLEAKGNMEVIINFTVAGRYGESGYEAAISRAQANILAALEGTGFVLRNQYRVLPAIAGTITAEGLKALERVGGLYIQENGIVTTQLLKNNAIINSDDLHALPSPVTGAGVNVAVLDTGIDPDHPNLVDDLVAQVCFASDCTGYGAVGDAADGDGHGTHVSGIITSNAPTAPGVAPDAGIVAVKVLDDSGSGTFADIAAAMEWVLLNHATYDIEVANMSLGGGSYADYCETATPTITTAMNGLRAANVAVFVATGNSATPFAWSQPACINSAISVGATYNDNYGSLAWSACTDSTTAVDKVVCFSNATAMTQMLAPGAQVYSTVPNDTFDTYSGTSMATPTAAAMAALLKQADPTLTVDELEQLMRGSGMPLLDHRNGQYFPRIDALAAYNAIMGSELPVFNDDIANPTPLQTGFTETVNTSDATSDPSDPTPTCGTAVGKTVWYSAAISSGGGVISFSTVGSGYDTVAAVYTGTPGSLTELGCHDGTESLLTAVPVPAGTVYVMVGGNSDAGGSLVVSGVAVGSLPPANDLVANATVVSSLPYNDTTNTTAATNDATTTCTSNFGKTVWYTYTPASNETVNMNTIGSNFDTVVALYTGTPASLTHVACDDQGGGSNTSSLTHALTGGTTYYIAVGGWAGSSGTIAKLQMVAVVPPANDLVENAVVITTNPFSDTLNTSIATNDSTASCVTSFGKTVWYTVVSSTGGSANFNTEGSSYDTVLAVYTGTPASLTQVACDDDGGTGTLSNINYSLVAGTTYYIAAGGYSGASGNLVFNATVPDPVAGGVPDAPTILTPTGTITDDSPAYSWTDEDADSYHLYVQGIVAPDTWGDVMNIEVFPVTDYTCTAGTCTYDPGMAHQVGDHSAWVRASNTEGWSDWSAQADFFIHVAPSMPVPTAPVGWITDTTPDFTFPEATHAHWYQLWLNDEVGNIYTNWHVATSICAGGTCAINTALTLDAGLYQYWLQSYNPAEYSAWTDTTYFGVAVVPDGPVGISPTGTIGDSTPDFVWNWDDTDHWYYLWVSDGIGFSYDVWHNAFDVCDDVSMTCTVNIGALADADYTWWLQAWSPAGYGAWNAGMTFTVDTTPSVNIAPVVEVAPVIAPAAVEPIQVELP